MSAYDPNTFSQSTFSQPPPYQYNQPPPPPPPMVVQPRSLDGPSKQMKVAIIVVSGLVILGILGSIGYGIYMGVRAATLVF